jgi:hypothetical protein
MLVAAFTAHRADPLFLKDAVTTTTERTDASGQTVRVERRGGTKEPALLYFIPALLFLGTGAGRYGIDPLIRGRRRGERASGDRG